MARPIPIIEPSLQVYFVDKTTGLPLSGGIVTFYKQDRTTLKPIYQLTGSPPDYTWTALPNPLTLSAVGTIIDTNDNDIIPYYFPYDGTPATTTGQSELYYITVVNSEEQAQFTREGWPSGQSTSQEEGNDIVNFIPNGQFVTHNNIVASSANNYISGQVSQNVTEVASGGWRFTRSGSTGVQNITFPRYNSSISNPSSNPRYYINISQSSGGSDLKKDLEIIFPFVNKFATNSELTYTFYFSAACDTSIQIQLYKHYFFGTGGSPSTEQYVPIDLQILTSSQTPYSFSVSFTLIYLQAFTIGSNNDDYIGLVIRLPNTIFSNAAFTNLALVQSNIAFDGFPTQTLAEQMDESTAGWFPVPDDNDSNGFNLYLPVLRGPKGLVYDNSQVGKVYTTTNATLGKGELYCDGTQYVTDDYSSDAIPYARLQSVIFNSTYNVPIFGTGKQFLTAIYPSSTGTTAVFRLIVNQAGAATVPDNGAGGLSAGFNFTKIHTGVNNYNFYCYMVNVTTPGTPTNALYINGIYASNVADSCADSGGGTATGFTFSTIQITKDPIPVVGTPIVPSIFSITNIAAGSGITGGDYFTLSVRNSGGSAENYYIWFKVNNVGTNPAPGGTGIEIDILSTDSNVQVTQKIIESLNGLQTYSITCVAKSSIPNGAYWTASALQSNGTTNINYYFWYDKTGSDVDPAPTGTGIKIDISSGLIITAADVANATFLAINNYSFAVPDLRGQFIRIWDSTNLVDPDYAIRYSFTPGYYGNLIGSAQQSQNLQHQHEYNYPGSSGAQAGVGAQGDQGNTFDVVSGGKESRPINIALKAIIKY